MKLEVKKLNETATLPERGNEGDAGLDLYCVGRKDTDRDGLFKFNTGIAVNIPNGYFGLITPRSSIYKRGLMIANTVGIIDSGYRGEILVMMRTISEDYEMYDIGDKIAQLIIVPYNKLEVEEVNSLESSERGEDGFGSTGD